MEMLETDLFNYIGNGVILKIESSDMEGILFQQVLGRLFQQVLGQQMKRVMEQLNINRMWQSHWPNWEHEY